MGDEVVPAAADEVRVREGDEVIHLVYTPAKIEEGVVREGEDEHVEVLVRGDQGVRKLDGQGRMHVVVQFAVDEKEFAAQVFRQCRVALPGVDVALRHADVPLAPTGEVAHLVVVARGGDGDLVEVWEG